MSGLGLIGLVTLCSVSAFANGEKLFGVHWWDYDGNNAGQGPIGGWTTETIVTHSAPWWQAPYFAPLFQQVHDQDGAGIITRIDYNWGETVPSPTNPDAANWSQSVVQTAQTLGAYSNTWIIGNEPNVTSEGNGWANNRVTPDGYAAVYKEVRDAIKAVRPNDDVLLAAPSPGGVAGPRWMSGNQWLGQTIDAVHNLGGDIDGFAIHAYGNPFAGADVAAAQFQASYASQLAVIDGRGHQDAPVYITEWARTTSTTGDLAANEAVTAAFITQALADLHEWNQGYHHNIVGTSWFVYNQDYGGWQDFSLEWWRSQGVPEGQLGDMWTALMNASQYPAGIRGSRQLIIPEPAVSALLLSVAAASLRPQRKAGP